MYFFVQFNQLDKIELSFKINNLILKIFNEYIKKKYLFARQKSKSTSYSYHIKTPTDLISNDS